jgi:type II secretory pathway component PulK
MAQEPINSGKQSQSPLAADSKGSILILALWALCILATFAVISGYTVRQKLILAYRLDERAGLRLIAEAGVKKAMAFIKSEPESLGNALKDSWSNNPGAFKDVAVGGATFSIQYDYIDELSGQHLIQYGLVDEERKININKADYKVLMRLFQITCGLSDAEAQDLAASIVDWRDVDNEPTSPSSAEDFYYQSLKYSYQAKNQDFETLDELLLVKGMAPLIFAQIKENLTIYGDGKVNINTAPRAVLLALGLSENVADKIVAFRKGPDQIIATSDDNIFAQANEAAQRLSALTEPEIAQLNAIGEQYLGSSSNNFTVHSFARMNSGKSRSQAICVIDRTGKILYWQES